MSLENDSKIDALKGASREKIHYTDVKARHYNVSLSCWIMYEIVAQTQTYLMLSPISAINRVDTCCVYALLDSHWELLLLLVTRVYTVRTREARRP